MISFYSLKEALELYMQSKKLYPNRLAEINISWIHHENKNYSEARKWYVNATNNSAKFGYANIVQARANAYRNLGIHYEGG